MKIKLVIADCDTEYAARLISHLNASYADQVETYSFSDKKALGDFLAQNMVDVLLLSDALAVDTKELRKDIAFAYFSDSPDVDTIHGVRTVCRYQRLDLIHKEILSLYSERETSITSYKKKGDSAAVITVLPASGGVGASTVAAAISMHLALAGRKVLYLNLEQCADTSLLFSGEGQATLSDVSYAIKSNRSNLKYKLESMVRRSPEGVDFFATPLVPLDVMELNPEEIKQLIAELQGMGSYECIVVDTDATMSEKLFVMLRLSGGLIWVSDGSAVSNAKLQRQVEAVRLLNAGQKLGLEHKQMFLYNKFSSRTSMQISFPDVLELGGLPRYEGAETRQVAMEISRSAIFDKLM